MSAPTPPAERCSPADGTADDTWHWLRDREGDVGLLRWNVNGWQTIGVPYPVPLDRIARDGYTYLAPVTPPAEVAGLTERVRVLEGENADLRQSRDVWTDRAMDQQRQVTELLCKSIAAAVQS